MASHCTSTDSTYPCSVLGPNSEGAGGTVGTLDSPSSHHGDCSNSCRWGDHSTPHPRPGVLHQLCFSIRSSAESGLNERCQGQHRKQRLPLLSLSSRRFGAREIAYRTLMDKKTQGLALARVGTGAAGSGSLSPQPRPTSLVAVGSFAGGQGP